MFASPLEVMPQVKAGRLNVIAVTSSKRVSYWPEVPTQSFTAWFRRHGKDSQA